MDSTTTKPVETQAGAGDAPTTPETRRMGMGAIVAWVVLLALMGVVAFGLINSRRGPLTIGSSMPDFSLVTFAGEEIPSRSLGGKVVVINFWASWCKPCEQEAADLEAAWRYYEPRGDVVFLGVDYVDTQSSAAVYLEKFDITYPNGPDLRSRISDTFRIGGVPETFIFDASGKLVHFQKGPFLSLGEIRAIIDPILP